MSIRIEYQPKDLGFAAFEAVELECFPDEPLGEGQFQGFLAGVFWAVWDNDRFVGYCCEHKKPDFMWLRRIGVAADQRRKDIGRQLMRTAIEWNRAAGLQETILYVEDDNAAAMALYESFGFRKAEVTYQYEAKVAEFVAADMLSGTNLIAASPFDQVPRQRMPDFPRQWTDIAGIHHPPDQFVLIFHDHRGDCVGYCRLTPGFPGCFPFALRDPEVNLLEALKSLKEFLIRDKDILRLTIDDPLVAEACEARGYHLNYKLFKMIRKEVV
jgi:ribosomal-protein-alanine N-acetyltransferase